MGHVTSFKKQKKVYVRWASTTGNYQDLLLKYLENITCVIKVNDYIHPSES